MRTVALRFLALVVFAMSAMAVTGSVHAHDLWLTAEGGANARRVVVNYGHPRDRPPTAADKILDLVAITGDKRLSLMDGLVAGSFPWCANRAVENVPRWRPHTARRALRQRLLGQDR
jgi:hypothetical protein